MKNNLPCKGLLSLVFAMLIQGVAAQTNCPPNMGFEDGTFSQWECFSGAVAQTGVVNVSATNPVVNRHTLYDKSAAQGLDQYGKFPVNCPNGSKYSIRLGNDQNGAQSERVSYTFTVPANQNDYSIIYNYAVVFQNPSHADYQQPRFTSRVFDVTSNEYVTCGSFEFVASAGLPGFKLSTIGQNVYYKPWSPITINLNGYAGKTIRLEFTNNDCTLGGHFGYAYLDVDENCASPITGNVFCNGIDSMRLRAPSGFQEYHWYNADFTQLLGTSNSLLINPPAPPNTVFNLEIIPYPNLGCMDTLTTTIIASPDAFKFKLADSIEGCAFTSVDLTAPAVTAGSSPALKFSYYLDLNEEEYLPNPEAVKIGGVYYIKAVSSGGCNEIKSIRVLIKNPPAIKITNPPQACAPGSADITVPAITAGSDGGLIYTYWRDTAATIALPSPNAVGTAGTYYVRGANSANCFNVKPVIVSIADLMVNNAVSCGSVNLTAPSVTAGTSPNLLYTYWSDAGASNALLLPDSVTVSGDYYIKANSTSGCSIVKSVKTTVHSLPLLTIVSPARVVFPSTINITNTFSHNPVLNYTYWKNLQATSVLNQPNGVGISGTYFIKATSAAGCTVIRPVVVVIDPPPFPRLVAPNVFSPNGDGINDVYKPFIEGEINSYHLKIFDRYGSELFDTPDINRFWDGTLKSKKLPAGTYYWIFQGTDTYRLNIVTQSGSVTLLR